MTPPSLIAWDFDGVLNRNIVDGRFLWADRFEQDLGLPLDHFKAHVFDPGRWPPVLVGQRDLRDLVSEWLAACDTDLSADAFIAYWFGRDAHPDGVLVSMLATVPARHVIATNNEARRAAYIMNEMGFGSRVDTIFAAGPMGVAKPDPIFFDAIADWAGLDPAEILLIDDHPASIDAAATLGWRTFHFTPDSREALPAALGLAP